MSFKFVDLFAGIGGFHAALSSLGGECVYASEIDQYAAAIYEKNWGLKPDGDITLAANEDTMLVPDHDVLVGGFPCQPFSKSGKQMGMEETRGTLFWNIAKIIEVRKPKIVLLENVRNIAGPRHLHEWDVIIATLRSLGYRVSRDPLVVSPHEISPNFGGRPQVRERVFIAATFDPKVVDEPHINWPVPDLSLVSKGWDPQYWNLEKDLPLTKQHDNKDSQIVILNDEEIKWIEAWNEFVIILKEKGLKLPGFPIWADSWVDRSELIIPVGTPSWKENFLKKNAELYSENKESLDAWLSKWNHLKDFPPSRRKLEWQAQDAKNLWETVMHFRPSGIRAKRSTYLPALVAITQTSIIGKFRRRINTLEAARLQGLPDWFSFEGQKTSLTYKQLGNGVNIGVVYNVLKAQVSRDFDLLNKYEFAKQILESQSSPDVYLRNMSVTNSESFQLDLN